MYKLSVTDSFSAAHSLAGYQGACSNLHGHNWQVRVAVSSPSLDGIGMALDFGVIKAMLKSILADFDHAFLNEVPSLKGINPTSENLARFIYERFRAELGNTPARISEVEVCESERSSVVYTDD
jgi:6-pyruvoyltetrahydropterin/6-carboxytetrahydropterin synthase